MKFKRLSLYIVFICTISILLITPAYSATYYVKSGGSDAADGLSDGNAWANLAKVNSFNFADGDVIQFKRGGTYNDAILTLDALTSPSSKTITIKDYSSGNLPVIGGNSYHIHIDNVGLSIVIQNINVDGQEFPDNYAAIWLENLADITIDNIEADGSVGWVSRYRNAIFIKEATGNVEIKNCTIQYWGGGSKLWGSPATPTGTYVDRSSIFLSNQTSGSVAIHDNTISNIEADGIQMEKVRVTTNIYDNTIRNCGENSIDIKGCINTSVYRNTLDRDATFIGTGGSSTGEGATPILQILTYSVNSSSNIDIYNNIIGPTDMVNIKFGADFLYSGSETVTDVNIYQNYFKEAKFHYSMYLGRGNHDYVYNVNLYNNVFNGLKNGGSFIVEYALHATGNKFYNNTFYSNNTGTERGLWLTHSNSYFKNNIFYYNDTNSYILWLSAGSPTVESNCYYNANGAAKYLINWKGSLFTRVQEADWRNSGHSDAMFADPLFNDPVAGDFSLSATSPCRLPNGVTLGANVKSLQSPKGLSIIQ